MIVRYADRPDLRARRDELAGGFPEFMYHNATGPRYWGSLYSSFPDFQLCLLDDVGEAFVGEAHSIPIGWDGSLEDLPAGWDEAFERGALCGREPTALCALAISIDPGRRGEGHSYVMIEALRAAASAAGFAWLVAPVRPTWKERYPLIAIERYAAWRRPDGEHFDPWLRTHEHCGAEILSVAPESMVIEAPVSDWEEWTAMRLPENGFYIVPGALAPLTVVGGVGRHAEPNVWVLHRL